MSATLVRVRAFVRALRPLHWSKNVLLLAPLALSHHLNDLGRLAEVAVAFAAFCVAASGTYLINDCRDLEADRAHPSKRNRPVAAGLLSRPFALAAGVILSIAAIAIGYAVSPAFAAMVAAYDFLTLLYSLVLKRVPLLDVLTLSGLYALRVMAGGVAAGVEVSDWLIALCGFLFVSLAMLKRYADLRLLAMRGEVPAGRGYVTGDADLLRAFGVTSGMLTVLVFSLYLTSPQVVRLYASPRLLWLVCPLLLFWVAHMWLLAHRGEIRDDPIIVATTEPASWIVAALIVVVAWAAV